MITFNFNTTKALVITLFLISSTLLISCEGEDDIPPPSAFVEPEPEPPLAEGECEFEIVVPTLADGLEFDCEGPEYTFFGNENGTITAVPAPNPDSLGINNSPRAIKVEQTPGLANFAGFFFDLDSKIDFSENKAISIKVYSPAVDQTINLKIEDSADGTLSTETSVQTTVANEWEELVFNFSSNDSDKYDRVVLFFNFLGDKSVTTIHYFDDMFLVEGGDTGGPGTIAVPNVAAPVPTIDESLVISLYSNAYTNVPVDTWRAGFSEGVLTDTAIVGDSVKKYSDLNFVGIETVANQIDASAMTNFHLNVWNANATEIRIKLVDFGPDGTFGDGDDTEHEITIDSPALEEWISLDLALADFIDLTNRNNIAQLIVAAAPAGQSVIYLDNVYFYDGTDVLTEPATAAPTPTEAEADVISMFSDAFTDVSIDTWRTDWSNATLEDIEIDGNATKKYTELAFVGVEAVTNPIDITSMVSFRSDIWTADATEIKIKLVDFGADGAFDGGDDVEHEITIQSPAQQSWISVDIPLTDFTGLTTKSNIAQLIYSAQPSGAATIFVDNVYFKK